MELGAAELGAVELEATVQVCCWPWDAVGTSLCSAAVHKLQGYTWLQTTLLMRSERSLARRKCCTPHDTWQG